MWNAGDSITNSVDVIDSRDIITRIKELEEEREEYANALAEAQDGLYDPDEVEEVREHKEAIDDAETVLRDWDSYDDGGEELTKLKEFAADVESQGVTTEWEDGAYFVRDDYFEEHAQEEAESMGLLESCQSWPANCIDWAKAADMLKSDYSCLQFDGEDYWVRSC